MLRCFRKNPEFTLKKSSVVQQTSNMRVLCACVCAWQGRKRGLEVQWHKEQLQVGGRGAQVAVSWDGSTLCGRPRGMGNHTLWLL